ncbi:hypothetical protein [Nocardiopsis halophila]|uniref:hypothetical protein n=1 Tax=Nocardiopsis halophila TaxID=141692 RepID=UPI00034BD87F|nr:hypothetical protein [Nocardiopsis halophila]
MRRQPFNGFALATLYFTGASWTWTVFDAPISIPDEIPAGTLGATVFSSAFIMMWLVGIHSRVGFSKDGVRFTNIFSEAFVPWCSVVSVAEPRSRQFVIRTKDGQAFGAIEYGGAPIGELVKYPTHRKVIRTALLYMDDHECPRTCLPTEWIAIPFGRLLFIFGAFQAATLTPPFLLGTP